MNTDEKFFNRKKLTKIFSQSLKKKVSRILIKAGITFLLLEFSLFLLVKLGVLSIITPTYHLDAYGYFSPIRNHSFGYQHQPNSTYYISKSCFNTSFKFNSLGFRAEEYSKVSNKVRVVVIGDSFMEGLGVSEEQRLSSLLEKETKIDHLNFAMANKGSCQEFIIYNTIASQFKHDAILWSIFPANDLANDDPMNISIDDIATCWDGEYPNYQLKSFPESAPDLKRKPLWKRFFKNFTYSYNALFHLKERFFRKKGIRAPGYFDYTTAQLNRLKYSIMKLKEKAGNKRVVIMCIPSHFELALSGIQMQESIEIPLQAICEELNIEFIGLYDEFKRINSTDENSYLACDSHWSQFGHEKAMDILLKSSKTYEALQKSQPK